MVSKPMTPGPRRPIVVVVTTLSGVALTTGAGWYALGQPFDVGRAAFGVVAVWAGLVTVLNVVLMIREGHRPPWRGDGPPRPGRS